MKMYEMNGIIKAGLYRKNMKPWKTNLWMRFKIAEGVSGYMLIRFFFFFTHFYFVEQLFFCILILEVKLWIERLNFKMDPFQFELWLEYMEKTSPGYEPVLFADGFRSEQLPDEANGSRIFPRWTRNTEESTIMLARRSSTRKLDIYGGVKKNEYNG